MKSLLFSIFVGSFTMADVPSPYNLVPQPAFEDTIIGKPAEILENLIRDTLREFDRHQEDVKEEEPKCCAQKGTLVQATGILECWLFGCYLPRCSFSLSDKVKIRIEGDPAQELRYATYHIKGLDMAPAKIECYSARSWQTPTRFKKCTISLGPRHSKSYYWPKFNKSRSDNVD